MALGLVTSPLSWSATVADSPVSGETVVILHGVWRSANSMRRMARTLEREGFTVVNETYPSLRNDIGENAEWLWNLLSQIDAPRIDFISHSMGGLVLRQMLADHDEPRLGRVVMIAPPSQGASLADHYSRYPMFNLLMGRAATQLRTGPEGVGESLPVPPCEFAIFAGARGHPRGWHPLIPGDDDGTVGVTEAYLPGASDFVIVHASHTFIMNNPRVIAGTVEFLRTGHITSAVVSAEVASGENVQ